MNEAKAYVDRIRYLIVSGRYEEYLSKEELVLLPTFEDLYKRCNKSRSWGLSVATKATYKSVLGRWFIPVIGQMRLDEITRRHLDTIKGGMIDKGLSPNTISNCFTPYYSVMRMAQDYGYIENVVKTKYPTKRAKNRLFVSPEVLRKIVECIKNGRPEHFWLSAYVMTQFYLVARTGEVLALKWNDIDWDNKTISISKHLWNGIVLEGTKNKVSNSQFPIHPELMTVLKEQYLRTGQGEWLFPATSYYKSTNKDRTTSECMYGPSQVLKLLARVGDSLELPLKLTTHAFRRGAADYMLRKGMTVHQVAYAMRTTTENVIRSYSCVNEEHFVKRYLSEFTTKTDTPDTQNGNSMTTVEVELDQEEREN
jgi:integrase